MSLLALVVYEAVRYATTAQTFNDVQDSKCSYPQVHVVQGRIYIPSWPLAFPSVDQQYHCKGIEVTYDMVNDNPKPVVPGKKEGTPNHDCPTPVRSHYK
ncbi:hypothetical protein H2248_005690 [Termitomyces sp. 'cryptogamus']|nr:hypothetical protein H2248_005690 [Termitomyces sp. 'cryptogamus']